MKASGVKMLFGLVIFLFSVTLAYFSANYLDAGTTYAHSSNYWVVLAGFAGAYVLVGIMVSFVFPVSLGFLFSADVLILHLLLEEYGKFDEVYKVLVVGFILFVLYVFAWLKMGDKGPIAPDAPKSVSSSSFPPSSLPPVA